MRYLYTVFSAWLLVSCVSKAPKLQQTFAPAGNKMMYLSHQHTYRNDVQNLYKEAGSPSGPSGLVIYTSLFLDVSDKIVPAKEIEDLGPFLSDHPGISPVLLVNVDKSLFPRIAEGEFDDRIARLAEFVSGLSRPVYISLGMEVNNPVYKNDPDKFVAAYRYIADKLNEHHLPNASFVWYVIGMKPSYMDKDPMAWYPGDEYVNWIGTSVYKIVDAHFAVKVQFTEPNYDRLLDISRDKKLPIMILESSANTIMKNFDYEGEALWNFWYRPFFNFVEENSSVKAIAHISQDWIMDEYIWRKWKEKVGNGKYLFEEDAALN